MIRTTRTYAAGLGAIACLLTSTAAFAADGTRSASALPMPTAQAALAPTSGVRSATKLKKKSNAMSQDSVIALSIVGVVAVGTGVYVALDDDDDGPDSPG